MNAVNCDPVLERVDAAAASARYALLILQQAQDGEKDADLYGCAMNEAEKALQLVIYDLKAAGAC